MELIEDIKNLGEKINDNLNDLSIKFKDIQENFLNSTIGKITNSAIDIGLKKVLPDFLENDVIEIKDTMLKEGLSEGVDKAVENAIDIGKTTIGIFTGNFETIGQAEKALKEGGVIDGISDSIDYVLNKLEKSDIISSNVVDLIKCGKDLILNRLENDINNEFSKEIESLSSIEDSLKKWEENYLLKDVEGINKEYSNMQEEYDKILPIESVANIINNIKNINEIINNSESFNFDSIYLDLAKVI